MTASETHGVISHRIRESMYFTYKYVCLGQSITYKLFHVFTECCQLIQCWIKH